MPSDSRQSLLSSLAQDKWFMSGDRVKRELARVAADIAANPSTDRMDDGNDGRLCLDGYRVENGVAVIPIVGVLTKYANRWDRWYGFISAEALEATIEKALGDYQVKSIVLLIDCPGGMVAGTTQAADFIAKINGTGPGQKPVAAIVSDLCASGGYYLASQCSKITANPAAEIGCIGVYCVLTDDAEFYKQWGISFTVVSSGGVKGLGADGKVCAELVADRQRGVDAHYQLFLEAIVRGRGFAPEQAKTLGDGRVWIASESKQLGLIDEVASLDDTMAAIIQETANMDAEQFKAYLAEHPDDPALASVKTTAANEARAAEGTRFAGIATAFGLGDHPAVASFKAGDTVEMATRLADSHAKGKAAGQAASTSQNEQLQALQQQNEQLKAELGKQPAITTVGSGAAANAEQQQSSQASGAANSGDPKAVAKAEWAKMSDEQKNAWAGEDVYVATRKRELTRGH